MDIPPSLLDPIVTQKQALEFVSGIDCLLEQMYTTSLSWEDQLQQCLSEVQMNIIQQLLKINQIQAGDHVAVEKTLTQLKQHLANINEYDISLAIDLPVHNLTNITRWLRNHTGKNVMLKIDVQPDLLAGIILNKEGTRIDYSLKEKINTMLQQSEYHIANIQQSNQTNDHQNI